ncbi:MAG: nitrate transporter substrate-binding protein [Gammaproteobacteria bacterium]|nr:nitrate transporter substrate-binding protein [Gammaproteobacteria bacterium]
MQPRDATQPMARFLGVILAASMSFAPGFARAEVPVNLGVVTWIGYGPIYCAAANRYYEKYGLAVKLVNFSDNSVMAGAVQSGEIDATTLTYDQVIAANARGWRLKVVMPVDYSVGGDAILASIRIHDIKELKGRKVAFMAASPSDFLLGYALSKDGLSEKDVQPVNTTPEGVVGIMAGGSADVGVSYEPNVSVIVKSGGGKRFHVLMSSREARGMITDVLVLKESTISKNPKLVDGLIRGTMEGLAFMKADPTKAAAIIAKTLEISTAEVREQLPNIENPPLADLGDVFNKAADLPSFYASGKIIGDILRREGQIEAMPAIEATYDASFVKALQANPGG